MCLLVATGACRRSAVPFALTDRQFWDLIASFSEPGGAFTVSDNVVSNEPRVAENARWLRPAGGVYIGVGPEQNFSYIARLRPVMAFVVDIRSENRNLHLLYKALFEVSADRCEFVSRLFSRPRPPDLASSASVEEIFVRYEKVPASSQQFAATLALVRDRLMTTRGLPLSAADITSIERILKAFSAAGPDIHFWGAQPVDAETVRPSYRELMLAKDWLGRSRSFLSTAEAFSAVRELHLRNKIVPVVGDFAGPRALRAIADYIGRHADVVQVFYGSNVGVYLNSGQTRAFCENLAALPVASNAAFIESDGVRSLASKLKDCAGRAQEGGRS